MSTVPDVRDLPITAPARAPSTSMGYICATIIVIAMLYFDGIVALTAAGAVAGAIVGIKIAQR